MAIITEELWGTIQKHRNTCGPPNMNTKKVCFDPTYKLSFANVNIHNSFDDKLDLNVYITNSIVEWKVSIMRSWSDQIVKIFIETRALHEVQKNNILWSFMVKLPCDRHVQYLHIHITFLKGVEHSLTKIGSMGTQHVGKVGLLDPPYALVALQDGSGSRTFFTMFGWHRVV